MIDELDLAFDERADERADKGRHRRSYVEKRNKKRRGGRTKTVVALLMSVILLGALGGGAWYGFDRIQGFFITPDYPGPGTGEVVVQVKAGQLAGEIAKTLATADVVKSAKAFVEAADENSRSRNIQAASYKMRKQMKAADALRLMLDPKSRVVNGLTIPEGLMTLQIYDKLSKETKIPVADFKRPPPTRSSSACRRSGSTGATARSRPPGASRASFTRPPTRSRRRPPPSRSSG